MKKKPSESRGHERAATSGGDKPALEAKPQRQSEADTVARAVLDALSAHDSM